MSRALLLDEMLTPQIALQLRRRGHDVDAVKARGELLSMPDAELLDAATKEDRAIVSMNVCDFARLDVEWRADGRSHGGLVLVPTSAFPLNRSLVGRLVRALDHALRNDAIPGPDGMTFLQPAPS